MFSSVTNKKAKKIWLLKHFGQAFKFAFCGSMLEKQSSEPKTHCPNMVSHPFRGSIYLEVQDTS